MTRLVTAAAALAATALAVAGSATAQLAQLQWVGTYESGIYDEDAAEQVTYDASTRAAYVANANSGEVDVISLVDPTSPVKTRTINVIALAQAADSTFQGDSVQGVEAAGGVVVAAVAAAEDAANGKIVFIDPITGLLLAMADAGVQPEALSINKNLTAVACVNEGSFEYNNGTDPVGGVTIVDIKVTTEPVTSVTIVDDNTYTFDGFTSEELLERGVRLFGPNADNPTTDLEPEGSAFSDDGKTLYVVLQDNNAGAAFDMDARTFTYVDGLAYPTAVMDPSDEDGGINIAGSWGDDVTVTMMSQPDGMAFLSVGGVDYIITANEGSSRDEYDFSEEERLADLTTTCASDEAIRANDKLGRLKVTTAFPAEFDANGNLECSTITTFGSRSFSVFKANPDGLELVYDSGSLFEEKTAALNTEFFNSNDDENNFDDRSDDKGPEPEAATIGKLTSGKTVVFIALERVGGIMVFDVSDPTAPVFNDFLNRRNFGDQNIADQVETGQFTKDSLDVGPESMAFVPAEVSPICADMLVVANAISGSTTVYKVVDAATERETDGSCNTATAPASCDKYMTAPALADVSECPASPPACTATDCGGYTSSGCGCDSVVCAIAGDCCPGVNEICTGAILTDGCSPNGSGDVNSDGMINVADITVLQNSVISGIVESPCIESAGDVNGDGAITPEDVAALVESVVAG